MNKRLKVALDVDGIIADFYKACCDYFGEPHDKLDSWSVSWIFHNEHIINQIPEFWRDMPLMPQAENGIDFEFDAYVSAYPAHMHDARREWILKNGFPDRPLIHSDNKVEYCKANGFDLLIDDRLATIKEADLKGLKRIFYIGDKYVDGYAAEFNAFTKFSDLKGEIERLQNAGDSRLLTHAECYVGLKVIDEGSAGTIKHVSDQHNVMIEFDNGGSSLVCMVDNCEAKTKLYRLFQ